MKQKVKRYLYHYRKEFGISVICFLICIFSLILLFPKSKVSSKSMELDTVVEKLTETPKIEPPDVIRVDIKGAVVNPGVYEMRNNSRVNDVIYQAGGVLESADLSRINLSKHVTDEMVIIVYTKEEIANYNTPKIEYVYLEPECICPDDINDACIESKEEKKKVSLNQASKEQLQTLAGIGSSKAEAIIEYRGLHPFESIDELKQVKGIGEAIFEKIKDNIVL